MRLHSTSFYTLMIISIFLGMILMLLPAPNSAPWLKFPFLELIVFFWIVFYPQKIHLSIIWLIGLMIDVLCNSPLGEHALIFILSSYLLMRFYQQFQMFPLWQQSAAMSGILLLYDALLIWLQHLLNQPSNSMIWANAALSFLAWPMVVFTLNYFLKNTKASVYYH